MPRLWKLGALGVFLAGVGYLLEAIRQRGDCEFGDKSPDTLGFSIALIMFGGGLLGLAVIVVATVSAIRHSLREARFALLTGMVSLASVAPLFMFAGDGPSTWFQYCAT